MRQLVITVLVAVLGVAPSRQAMKPDIESNPTRERLADAIERGDVDAVRAHLDAGGDVNEAWRDVPAQIVRSLLLRSVWYGREEIFRLLLDRGADVATVNGYFTAAVHSNRVDIVRTVLARGLKPEDTQSAMYAALQHKNLSMIELLWSSNLGFAFGESDLPGSFLTSDIARLLIPKYVSPNAQTGIGNETCDVARILGVYRRGQDGCEGATGPLWLHFVVTGNTEMVAYCIDHGAKLSAPGHVDASDRTRAFGAMDIARARKDRRMIELLRRSGVRER